MNKRFGLFLIVAFISMQMLSIVHLAEHDYEQHQHNGQVCNVYLIYQHAHLAAIPTCLHWLELSFVQVFILVLMVSLPRVKKLFPKAAPRAPPVFS